MAHGPASGKTITFSSLRVSWLLSALEIYTGSEFNDKEQKTCLLGGGNVDTAVFTPETEPGATAALSKNTGHGEMCLVHMHFSFYSGVSAHMYLVFVPGKGFSPREFGYSENWIHLLVNPRALAMV